MVLTHPEGQGRRLTIRVPAYPENDQNSEANLGHLISLATTVLQIDPNEVRLSQDLTLGASIAMPNKIQKLLDLLKSSALASTGDYPGEVYKFDTGFMGNVVELIAAIRLLSRKSEIIRKRHDYGPRGPKSVSAVNQQVLLEKVYSDLGVVGKTTSYGQKFVRTLLSLCTRRNTEQFPPGWNYALKKRNGCAGPDGVIYRLGYAFIVPESTKTMTVLLNSVKAEKDGQVKLTDLHNEADGLTYREFRTGVALILPKLNERDPSSMEDQAKAGPERGVSEEMLQTFSGRSLLVDSLNGAYAIYKAIPNKDSKAKPVNFRDSRDRTINLSVGLPMVDRQGVEYSKVEDIPQRSREYLLKALHYKLNERKRQREEAPSGDAMDVEGSASDVTVTPISVSVTKRRASERVLRPRNEASSERGKGSRRGKRGA